MVIGPDYQGGRIGQGNQAAQPGQGHRGQPVQEKAIAYPTDWSCPILTDSFSWSRESLDL
jgi:hypothetical protein